MDYRFVINTKVHIFLKIMQNMDLFSQKKSLNWRFPHHVCLITIRKDLDKE